MARSRSVAAAAAALLWTLMATAAAAVVGALPRVVMHASATSEAPRSGDTLVFRPSVAQQLGSLAVGASYHLVYSPSTVPCSRTWTLRGEGGAIAGVAPSAARLFEGERIAEAGRACAGRGLSVVATTALAGPVVAGAAGVGGAAARLTASVWATQLFN